VFGLRIERGKGLRGAKTESRRKSVRVCVCAKNEKGRHSSIQILGSQHSERENHILRFVRSNYIDKKTASCTITVVEMWGKHIEGEQGFLF